MTINNLKKGLTFCFFLIFVISHFKISVSEENSQKNYREVKNYLSHLKSLSADFIQISSDGNITRGKIHISLPGKLRIAYENPNDILITSNGFWLVVQNRKIKQTNNYPLSKTPLDLFLNKKIDFDDRNYNLKFHEENGVVKLKFLNNKEMISTSFQLFFKTNPVQLKKWEIIDEFDNKTSVSFQNLTTGQENSHLLFFPEDFGEENDN